MTLLESHITFIEKTYGKSIHGIPSNIGWVSTDNSITSKIYSSRELIESSRSGDTFVHSISSF